MHREDIRAATAGWRDVLTPEQLARCVRLSIPLARRATALRTGVLDPEEFRADLIANVGELDPVLGAFIGPRPEVLRQARLPWTPSVTYNDTIDVAGYPTTLGIRAGHAPTPSVSAQIVKLLAHQGFAGIGKVASTECALGTERPSRNPRYPHVSAAGSSTGSAVAVAAGFCDISVGSDAGGSLRRPAVYCGVTALRLTPTPALLDGVHCVSPSMESVGLVTRSPADLAWLWREHELPRALGLRTEPGWRPLRVAVTRPPVPVHPDMLFALGRMRDRLADLGHRVREPELPSVWEMIAPAGSLLAGEASVSFGWLRYEPGVSLQPGTLHAIERGDAVGTVRLAGLRQTQRRAGAHMLDLFTREFDLLVMPLETQLPDRAVSPLSEVDDDALGSLTLVANFAVLPVLALPVALSSEDSPAGVQVLAAPGREDLLVAVGEAVAGDVEFGVERWMGG